MIATTLKRNMQKNSPLCVQFIKSYEAAESIKCKHVKTVSMRVKGVFCRGSWGDGCQWHTRLWGEGAKYHLKGVARCAKVYTCVCLKTLFYG